MGRYLIRRLLWGAFTLWGLATAVFFLLRLFPGGPFEEDLALKPEIKAALENVYRVSGSGIEHYLTFLSSCLRGDLGVSLYFTDQSVASILERGLRSTVLLNLTALALVVLLSFVIAIGPHLWPAGAKSLRTTARLGLALPGLFLAPLFLWIFSFHLDWFPLRVNESIESWVLPVFLLSFRPACGLGRLLDVRISEEKRENYTMVHRSMGVSEQRLVTKWILRVSLPAFVQQLPALAAGLLSGSLLIETLFAINGLGTFFTQSLLARDWPLALGLTLFFGCLLVVLQMFADLLMMLLDPRVRVK